MSPAQLLEMLQVSYRSLLSSVMILKSEHHVTSLLSEISLLSDKWKMKLHNDYSDPLWIPINVNCVSKRAMSAVGECKSVDGFLAFQRALSLVLTTSTLSTF